MGSPAWSTRERIRINTQIGDHENGYWGQAGATYSPLTTTGSGKKGGRGFGEQVITFGMVLSHATRSELKCYLPLSFCPWLVLKIDGRNQGSRKCSLTRSSIAFRVRTALITLIQGRKGKVLFSGMWNIEFQESLSKKHIVKWNSILTKLHE